MHPISKEGDAESTSGTAQRFRGTREKSPNCFQLHLAGCVERPSLFRGWPVLPVIQAVSLSHLPRASRTVKKNTLRVHFARQSPLSSLQSHRHTFGSSARSTQPQLSQELSIVLAAEMNAPSMAPSGSQAPTMLSSTARPLQLDQWANTKAPLTSSQRASVNRLAEWLHRNSSDFRPQHEKENPPPSNLDGHANPDATNKAIASDGEASNGTVKHTSAKSSDAILLPEKGAPLASAQDFLAWYTQLSDSITSSTQTSIVKPYSAFRTPPPPLTTSWHSSKHVRSTCPSCAPVLPLCRISSRGIREQAQSLLDSHTHLDTLAEEIASRLSFFTLLPYATNMLSSPDSSIVYSQSFLELMDQLDMALLFLQQEPAKSYRDAALYRMRYSQCVTRAATLAKMAVVRDFRAESERTVDRLKGLDSSRKSSDAGSKGVAESTADAKGKARELTDSAANGSTESALTKDAIDVLFGGAEHQVAKLRPLIFELQKRASNTAESSTPTASTAAEFESQLQECRVAWFQYRRPLLSRVLLQRIVEVEIRTSSQQSSLESLHPLVQYARSGTDLVRSILQKEHDLYQQFFGTDASGVDAVDDVPSQQRETDAALASYLAEIADTFTARLRPKLFKEENLVVLAQTSAAISDTVYADGREGLGNEACKQSSMKLSPVLSREHKSSSRLTLPICRKRGTSETSTFPNASTYKASLLSLGAEQNSASATPTAAAAPTKGQHRRGKSGAGLLDAALPTAHAASSSSKAQQEKVELFTPLLLSWQPITHRSSTCSSCCSTCKRVCRQVPSAA